MKKFWEFVTAAWDWYVLRTFFYYFPPKSSPSHSPEQGQTLDDD